MLALAFAVPAHGQQRLKLTEDDQWLPEEQVDPDSPQGQLLKARRLIIDGEPGRTKNLIDDWLERTPNSPLAPRAYLIRGDALTSMGDYYEALFDYEAIARLYPASESFVTALQREFEIAKIFAGGLNRKLWGLRLLSAQREAEELLIRIQERLPGSQLAEKAGMALADYYFNIGEMDLAAQAYSIYIENFPRSKRISRARRRLIYSHLATYKGPRYDPEGLYEARAQLRRLIVLEPATAQKVGAEGLLVSINEADAEKLLEVAKWYRKVNDPIGAEMAIRRLIQAYPRTVAARKGLQLAVNLLDDLPSVVLEEAPDYKALLTGRTSPVEVEAEGDDS